MITPYFQQELTHLKELAAEFAKAHPALAPMLGGPSADPDVERLLEGVAFQTALLREKLDDDFPEIIHELVRLVSPHYLRPIPASTVVAFTPAPSLTQSQTIPAGVQLASVPVEGTRCLFRTCGEVELHPLELRDTSFSQPSGRAPAVTLSLELGGIPLSDWRPRSLRLFLAGEYAQAADLYLLLMRHLRRIVITPADGGKGIELPPDCLKPAGFAEDEPLIPYPSHAFPGYRLLQEYFTAPARFLFVELTGWERWTGRGSGSRFTVSFELAPAAPLPARVTSESFALFAVPAVNLFYADAVPIILEHRSERHLVRPAGLPPGHAQVFSVDRVSGFVRGTAEKHTFLPFEQFRQSTRTQPAYHTTTTRSPVGPGFDIHLWVASPQDGTLPEMGTLSVELTCTNGSLPENLRAGDVREPTGSSPNHASFRNITPVTATVLPPLGRNLLWRLLAHQARNSLFLDDAGELRELLNLYIFEENRDRAGVTANRKRIEGIEGLSATPADRLVGGIFMRGVEIRLRLRGDHFAGAGDMFLFASVLDQFLSGYASINTYTRLTVEEVARGEIYQWPARLGQQPLL
ncbi:type VI secretion system baseplate subunit TssF [Geobacter sp.]|uniref:type VI secretion system baseplate subunit TssF n=1 Tax=Geobacter sp. TaxID=46610 RepID=UPI002611944F|nr:type VI secretion system baseplate subunit TssF [Geobacter sp.]